MAAIKVGVEAGQICDLGDRLINERAAKVFKKEKDALKGTNNAESLQQVFGFFSQQVFLSEDCNRLSLMLTIFSVRKKSRPPTCRFGKPYESFNKPQHFSGEFAQRTSEMESLMKVLRRLNKFWQTEIVFS